MIWAPVHQDRGLFMLTPIAITTLLKHGMPGTAVQEKASADPTAEAFWYVSERKLLPNYKFIGIHFNTIVNQAEGIDTAGIRLQVDAVQFR